MGPPIRKGHGSTTPLTRNAIPIMVSVGSSGKWPEHGGGTVRDLKQPFLSPYLLLELESGTYQLVSLRASI